MIAQLEKMRVAVEADRVQYFLDTNDGELHLNPLINSVIRIRFEHKIHCVCCGKEISKTFFNGFCYRCFTVSPQAEECVLNPEKCRAHEGIARDMAYAQEHCLSPQVVYLALSGGIKVGVTRQSQVPTRWVDQGASHAVAIAVVPNRYTAGCVEVALKQYVPDKSNWRKLITGDVPDRGLLLSTRSSLPDLLPSEYLQYFQPENVITELFYPIVSYLPKAISLNLDKQPLIEGRLLGIRGQYLLIEGVGALNIRSHSGYEVDVDFEES